MTSPQHEPSPTLDYGTPERESPAMIVGKRLAAVIVVGMVILSSAAGGAAVRGDGYAAD